MAGKHSGDEYGFPLGEALSMLDTGPEPPMPDLVPGAITQGTRIRRRRRIGVALGTAAMAVAVAGAAVGGYGVLTPTAQSPRPLPAANPSVWYPSPALLRAIISPKTGTVQAARKQPGPYFRLTDPTGLVTDLYVTVARSTGSPLLLSGAVACRDGFGRELTTPWGGLLFKCSTIEAGPGSSLLEYYTEKKSLPPQMRGNGGSNAWGISHLTSGGWKVQVIASPHDEGRKDEGYMRNRHALIELATDPRIFDAVTETRG